VNGLRASFQKKNSPPRELIRTYPNLNEPTRTFPSFWLASQPNLSGLPIRSAIFAGRATPMKVFDVLSPISPLCQRTASLKHIRKPFANCYIHLPLIRTTAMHDHAQNFMALPTRDDINVHDSLDERSACEHFFGKTLEGAETLFRENSLYY
jgi:hypothetical protein